MRFIRIVSIPTPFEMYHTVADPVPVPFLVVWPPPPGDSEQVLKASSLDFGALSGSTIHFPFSIVLGFFPTLSFGHVDSSAFTRHFLPPKHKTLPGQRVGFLFDPSPLFLGY